MLRLKVISSELAAARPFFKILNPSASNLVIGPLRMVVASYEYGMSAWRLRKANDSAAVADYIGDAIGYAIIRKARRPLKRRIVALHKSVPNIESRDFMRKNGMGGRSWYDSPHREEMIIVFHDANRAGPHVDVHLGRLSLVYRVKPDLYAKLKYNREGRLTEDSRKLIIDHVRGEIKAGSRVPQNLDHSLSNARASWTGGDPEHKAYGAGRTRQIVSTSTIDIYKAHRNGPIEMYAPLLNPSRALYLYRLYPGDAKRAPIMIWGEKTAQPPKLEDRLHLKLMDPDNMNKVIDKADMTTSTAKYDGSSAYIVITPKGTTVWSPRQSVKTGEQIEYTFKLDGLANLHSDETIVAMGELLFRRWGSFPWRRKSSTPYLSSAIGSGILNSNDVLPTNVVPELRLYRIDRIGRRNTSDLDFWNNRLLQESVALLDPHFKVVELMSPDQAKLAGFEGFVAIPHGLSVNDGMKVKWWSDAQDWRIDSVDFKPGEKGGLAGVVWLTSLESGKKFKLGPGQVGNRLLTEQMMHDPDGYVGTVLKVQSRHGHEGRAAKVVAVHDDKGFAAV